MRKGTCLLTGRRVPCHLFDVVCFWRLCAHVYTESQAQTCLAHPETDKEEPATLLNSQVKVLSTTQRGSDRKFQVLA